MYNLINLSNSKKRSDEIENKFSLNLINKESYVESCDDLYTEAVFSSGKQTVEPLVGILEKIKNTLEEQITSQEQSEDEAKRWKRGNGERPPVKSFNPKAFWKNELFKELEDKVSNIFGFRVVIIQPYLEKYVSRNKMFQSKILNCEIYSLDRYPIEGLVSDKGFYDKTKSLIMDIRMTLGLIRTLSAEELLAVLLHEFGHSIDPALVDIKYTETNILTKYITDRKGSINKHEKTFINKFGEKSTVIINYLISASIELKSSLVGRVEDLFLSKDRATEKKMNKIREMIQKDKTKFTRQEYSEAFADNFARMYGYGPQLMSGLSKIHANTENIINSRIKKEKARQAAIMQITQSMIKDVHKTDIHRIRALIKEYNNDINDENTPEPVKKQLKEDLAELEKVLDQYLNNFSDFQNMVNRTINEELKKLES